MSMRSQASGGLDLAVIRSAGAWPETAEATAEAAARLVLETLAETHLPQTATLELAITLADDAAVRMLNRRYRGRDKATNVLSFPQPAPLLADQPHCLGDVILAAETCAAEAADQGKPLPHHLSHLVIHGVLHLLGEDHETEDAAIRMEALERQLCARLGISDPYANVDLAVAVPAPDRLDNERHEFQ